MVQYAHGRQRAKTKMNQLYYGDNLDVMRDLPTESIDLIYLDPPFNSKKSYNFLYSQAIGKPLPEEAVAFCDAWTLDEDKEKQIREFELELKSSGADPDFIKFWETWILTLRNTNSQLLAYLVYMTVRLWEMKRLLKKNGNIFLHCDPTASHYIKVIMDGIFGHDSYRNEIIWGYKTGGASKRWFARKHDVIFFYAKSKNSYFKPQYYKSWQAKRYNYNKNYPEYFDDDEQRWYHLSITRDVWEDIQPLGTSSKERIGYPTQKPIALLERIIDAACPPDKDAVVFDPFCGCGTTLAAAEKLKKRWVGIDICLLATTAMEKRLQESFNRHQGKDYELHGIPVTTEQAVKLAVTDNSKRGEGRFQFQYWAIESVGGFASTKKTGDGGVDGSIYFYKNLQTQELGRMIVSVKSDKHVKISQLRDLIGTLSNSDADMAGLVCLDEPTDGMRAEARAAGMVTVDYGVTKIEVPKVQILSVKDIIERKKKFDTPLLVPKKKSDPVHPETEAVRLKLGV